ncbi:MAG: DUF5658 family protein [Gammaproteobacteria bacterium]
MRISGLDRPYLECCPRRGDRRQTSWRAMLYGAWRGRRVDERRCGLEAGYVDRYGPWVTVPAVILCLLSAADALLTLQLVARGARELNPLMGFMLGIGRDAFVGSKLVLVTSATLILVMHKNFRLFKRFSGAGCLRIITAGFAVLVAYECVLIAFV